MPPYKYKYTKYKYNNQYIDLIEKVCLKCNRKFPSRGKENRICYECKHTLEHESHDLFVRESALEV